MAIILDDPRIRHEIATNSYFIEPEPGNRLFFATREQAAEALHKQRMHQHKIYSREELETFRKIYGLGGELPDDKLRAMRDATNPIVMRQIEQDRFEALSDRDKRLREHRPPNDSGKVTWKTEEELGARPDEVIYAKPPLSEGTTVQLKSGGPHLTVEDLSRNDGCIHVVWFDVNGCAQRDAFHRDALKVVEK